MSYMPSPNGNLNSYPFIKPFLKHLLKKWGDSKKWKETMFKMGKVYKNTLDGIKFKPIRTRVKQIYAIQWLWNGIIQELEHTDETFALTRCRPYGWLFRTLAEIPLTCRRKHLCPWCHMRQLDSIWKDAGSSWTKIITVKTSFKFTVNQREANKIAVTALSDIIKDVVINRGYKLKSMVPWCDEYGENHEWRLKVSAGLSDDTWVLPPHIKLATPSIDSLYAVMPWMGDILFDSKIQEYLPVIKYYLFGTRRVVKFGKDPRPIL